MLKRQIIAETIGTFSLVFAGCGAIVVNDVRDQAITHIGISLTFGLVVMAMIYAVGDISGAHLNPAVTCGFWIAGRLPGERVVPFVAAQLLGAFLAAGLLRSMFPEHQTLGSTLPSGSWWQSFVFEIVLTFILMYVILCVAIGAKEKGIMAGAAIGATVGLEAMFAGPISGASMNPARSLGPAIVSATFTDQWIYVVAPVLGAAFAVLAWHQTRDPETTSD